MASLRSLTLKFFRTINIDTSKRIYGLDIVRVVAILLVLMSHSVLLVYPNSDHALITVVKFFGALGVDIFFVLSGFLIGTILIKQIEAKNTKPKHFVNFWLRRWFRTLPNYYLVLLVNIVLLFVFTGGGNQSLYKYGLFLQNFNQPQSAFFPESWSLSIEEFAYIIGPLLLLVLAWFTTLKKRHFLIMTIVVITLITINRIAFNTAVTTLNYETWSAAIRKVVIYRIDSIYYGFIAAYVAFYYPKFWAHKRYLLTSIGAVLFIVMHFSLAWLQLQPTIHSTFYNVFYLPLLSISIALVFPLFTQLKQGQFAVKPITYISVLSYAIYMVNYSIVLLSIQHLIDVNALLGIEKLLLVLCFWGITFLLSHQLYTKFEKPIMDIRDKFKWSSN